MTTLIGYLLLQLIVCLIISKKIKNQSDYLVAGRQFSVGVVSISLFATWFGAETCIGSSAAVFKEGLSGSRADPIGYGLCLFLSGLLIAPKLWNHSRMTLADFYRERFGEKVEQLSVILMAITSLIWGAAQLRAFGHIINATTSIDLVTSVRIGLIFVVAYTLLGGLVGDMITDVIQGAVIAIGLVLILVVVLSQTPPLTDLLAQQSSQRWQFLLPEESWWERLDRLAIPIVGSLVAQEIVSRLFAAHSKKIAIRSCFIGGVIYMLLGSIPVFLGFIGPQIMPQADGSENFLIDLAALYLHPMAMGIFAGALISALLATIDSILLSVSALIGRNFLIPKLKIVDTKKQLLMSRVLVVLSGLAAYFLSSLGESIYELLEIASSFGSAGIFTITILGLWTKLGGPKEAFLVLIIGVVAMPISEYVFNFPSPYIFSLLLCFLVYGIYAGLLARPKNSL
jgi:Na+/proline symporter